MTRRNLPARVAETPLQPQLPVLVLFGCDEAGKPRAAAFTVSQVEAATAAAALMKMRTLRLVADEHRAFASQLARGRVFASGRAFTPYVRQEVYGRLVEIAGGTAGLSVAEGDIPTSGQTPGHEQPSAAEPAQDVVPSAPPVPPQQASMVSKGADVQSDNAKSSVAAVAGSNRPADRRFVGSPLPQDRDEIGLGSFVLAMDAPAEGWWEAEVIGINGSVYSLRWRDYPTEPTLLRKAGELALLPPNQA
jgi:hypothetical protein